MTSLPAFGAAVRIARRDAWRHRGRSALIISMVLIPVFGLSCADVVARTMQLDPGERASREIGHADVGLFIRGGKVQQALDPLSGFSSATPKGYHGPHVPLLPGGPAYTALLDRAVRTLGANPKDAVPVGVGYRRVTANNLATQAEVGQVDLRNPLTADLGTLRHGQVPSAVDQAGVTPSLASALGLHIGDEVNVDGKSLTVSGIVNSPLQPKAIGIFTMPGTIAIGGEESFFVVRTPRPVTWATVQRLNAIGVAALSRAVILKHPSAISFYYDNSNPLNTKDAIGVETVAIGLAILEVTLLAGAAFAVGVRRQRHDLALVAAVGGDAGIVRSVVLASGLLLGLTGTVFGIVLGIALAPAVLPFVSHHANKVPGHFDVRPLEVLGVGLLGLVTGLAAAVLPARSAGRDDVVLGLSGRRGVVHSQRKVPVIGVAMIVVGVVVAVQATHNFHFRVILAGAVLSELGFVVCAPALVGLVGRLGRYVGLAPRLALRDAARHRGRSGPAVAAIMAAVAGSIAVSTYFATEDHDRRLGFAPESRVGQAYYVGNAAPAAVARVMRDDLGATRVDTLAQAYCIRHGKRCRQGVYARGTATDNFNLVVGGPSLLADLTGSADPAAARALEQGKAVVFDRANAPAGSGIGVGDQGSLSSIAAYHDVVGKLGSAAGGLISPAAARRAGIKTRPGGLIAITPAVPTDQQLERANAQLPLNGEVAIGRGYHSGDLGVGTLILAIVASLVTLGATAVAVGLSMAESKPDLMTLSAVGGRPMTRRLLVASQAGTISILGAAQGVVAGLIPAWAILRALHYTHFTPPWSSIALVVIGIPLLAMIGTGLAAGSRLNLDRRLA